MVSRLRSHVRRCFPLKVPGIAICPVKGPPNRGRDSWNPTIVIHCWTQPKTSDRPRRGRVTNESAVVELDPPAPALVTGLLLLSTILIPSASVKHPSFNMNHSSEDCGKTYNGEKAM